MFILLFLFSISVVSDSLDPMDHSTPGFPVYHQWLELAQTHVHWVGDAIQPSHLSSLLLLPSVFPSISIFSSESVLHIRWPKYWSFIFSISPSNEYSGLISFRMDWFDILAVNRTLRGLLQHHSSKASTHINSLHSLLCIFSCIYFPRLETFWEEELLYCYFFFIFASHQILYHMYSTHICKILE